MQLSVSLLALLLCSCSFPKVAAEQLAVPDRAQWKPVADALQPNCATLDCHGQPGRNLRLYGGQGLRLAVDGNPNVDPTTDLEYQASYQSLVDLEPEALDKVVAEAGRDPERLSMVRKARGSERHTGGVQMLAGDPLDVCLISWLSGTTDSAACMRVSRAPRPKADP
jgi:hypothetical protein